MLVNICYLNLKAAGLAKNKHGLNGKHFMSKSLIKLLKPI